MLIELTATERYDQERALPAIFANGFHPERIDWYTRLTIESEAIRGGAAVIPEFIAAMILEANLNNRAFGDSNAASPHFGVTWLQLDTGSHAPQNTATLVEFRGDPLLPLLYAANTPDLTTHHPNITDFNKRRWNAWYNPTTNRVRWDRLDPQTGWSPYKAATDAYQRITGQ